jgi:hypothetical protein
MLTFKRTLHTAGNGYWSNTAAAVAVTKIDVPYINDDGDFGELRVHFKAKSWDVNELGLIYTDSKFLAELRKELTAAGLDGKDVDYSEQGMQGDTYVSLDVGKKFINDWNKLVAQFAI